MGNITSSNRKPNLIFLFADQLNACSLPIYGEDQIETPHMDRLAREGKHFTNAISSFPVCTPYRSMLVTGRYPQTTGHIINFIQTRHNEISIGDVFSQAGYHTAWVGKWHLHTGAFPNNDVPDFVPEGRSRLGFEYWRGYNFHMNFFGGTVNKGDWRNETWDGYETSALNHYAFEFLDQVGEDPFCLFISPHQPHGTHGKYVPEEYEQRVTEKLRLRENVPDEIRDEAESAYRKYLAMILALDDMLGELMAYLDRSGQAENTILVFSSDHGTQMGAHGCDPWMKKQPYEESIQVPLIIRYPGVIEAGGVCDHLVSPVDLFPSLCGLCGLSVPRTVEGMDLSKQWLGDESGADGQDSVFLMSYSATFDYLEDGNEWRGVRTRTHTYVRWLDGRTELYDLRNDRFQLNNLAGDSQVEDVEKHLEETLQCLMQKRKDDFAPTTSYQHWFDEQRRVICNASGKMSHPESEPDWSLL